MDRRDLLKGGLIAAAAAATPGALASRQEDQATGKTFRLKYAPHLGMFKHHAGDDPLDQIRFMHDEGFTAFEDNGMRGRPPELQQKIGDLLEKLGMTMGVFVANSNGFGKPSFSAGRKEDREVFLRDVKTSVEVQKRVRAKWATVVLGDLHHRLELDYQTANAIDTLRMGAEICEPSGLVMVLEPLNPWRDHPNMLLAKIPHAYLICRAVNSPSCKILFDMYHQQIAEGNIIPNIDHAWSEVGYFQIGDNPGRKEPTTGEMNYRNIFGHIARRGFDGVLGMEHGNSQPGKEGERRLINAYRECDGF